jgi:two-component system alkaline phosphatase synthesis response regulator PhoP
MENVKLLIIDDEAAVCQMYKFKLEMEQFKVVTLMEAEKSLEVAKQEQPNIILLDIIMPKVNGLDILRELKSDNETKNIPVYILTNLPNEAGGAKGLELGAAGYFVKAEYEPSELARKIRDLIGSQPNDQQPV